MQFWKPCARVSSIISDHAGMGPVEIGQNLTSNYVIHFFFGLQLFCYLRSAQPCAVVLETGAKSWNQSAVKDRVEASLSIKLYAKDYESTIFWPGTVESSCTCTRRAKISTMPGPPTDRLFREECRLRAHGSGLSKSLRIGERICTKCDIDG